MTDNSDFDFGNPDMSDYSSIVSELPDWKQPAARGTRSMTRDQMQQFGLDHIDFNETGYWPSQQDLPEEKWY